MRDPAANIVTHSRRRVIDARLLYGGLACSAGFTAPHEELGSIALIPVKSIDAYSRPIVGWSSRVFCRAFVNMWAIRRTRK
jgi:hypothetical protein